MLKSQRRRIPLSLITGQLSEFTIIMFDQSVCLSKVTCQYFFSLAQFVSRSKIKVTWKAKLLLFSSINSICLIHILHPKSSSLQKVCSDFEQSFLINVKVIYDQVKMSRTFTLSTYNYSAHISHKQNSWVKDVQRPLNLFSRQMKCGDRSMSFKIKFWAILLIFFSN